MKLFKRPKKDSEPDVKRIKRRKGNQVLSSGEVVQTHEWWHMPNYHIHLQYIVEPNLWECTIDPLTGDIPSAFGIGPKKRDALENAIKMINKEMQKKYGEDE